MHTFLRAIGFSKINNRKSLDIILEEVIKHPDEKIGQKINDNEDFVEITKYFGNDYGITVRGVYDEKGIFHMEHYFPFLNGDVYSIKEELTISKKSEDRAFSVMCDDVRLGVLLIFYLQNVVQYINCIQVFEDLPKECQACISGLSTSGKIILPVDKCEDDFDLSEEKRNHNKMVFEARNGDEEAIEQLAVEDIDMYMMINDRVKDEDLYSIVDTSFFPYGSESDNYAIIGTILEYKFEDNSYSGETICNMLLECNDIKFNVCINQEDLYGMPMIGARFKGTVWLQGRVEF